MAMLDLDYNLHRQTEAAKSLLSSLRDQGVDDDAELVADAIEGETNLIEAIEAAIAQLDECDVLITGLKAKEEEFETRRKSIERRAERVRALIEQAMLATDQTSLKLPTATLSLTKRAPGLIVNSEAEILPLLRRAGASRAEAGQEGLGRRDQSWRASARRQPRQRQHLFPSGGSNP